MEGLGLAAGTRELLMPQQRDLNDEDGTIVTMSAPTPPAPLHRRPRTDQRLLSAAPEALPLTEMHLRSLSGALACLVVPTETNAFSLPSGDGSAAANGRMVARLSKCAATARHR